MIELGLGPALLGGVVGSGWNLGLVVALYLGLVVNLNLYMLYKLGVVFTDRIWYIKRIN